NRGDAVIDNPLACRLLGDPDGRLFNNTVPDADVARSRGQRWAAGSTAYTAVNTILPPNSPSCATGDFASAGQYPINSRHTGGAQVLLGDGSVRFISENIDTGDLSQPDPKSVAGRSPYGVWGALGSI